MKILTLTYIFVIIGLALTANPIYMPISYLEKLSFDKNKNWQIYLNTDIRNIDSIAISSSSGFSKCKVLTLQQEVYFDGLIITTDSLISRLSINPEGDSVSIISYFHDLYPYPYLSGPNELTETFIFGNYKNSNIPKPSKDQVIKAFWTDGEVPFYHCLCDSSGNRMGTIKGHVYNRNNVLITNGSISINPYPFYLRNQCVEGFFAMDAIDIGSDGTYNCKFYAQNYSLNQIGIYSNLNQCYYYKIGNSTITPIDFSIYPDSTINLDIHLLEDFTGNQKLETRNNELLKIFPNPIKGGSFHYEIGPPVKATHCMLDLIDMSGRKLKSYDIIENSGELQLPSTISNGTYLLQFQMNGKKIFSDQIIVSEK